MAPKNHNLTTAEMYDVDDGILEEKLNSVSTAPDIYGQSHPIETPALIAEGFANLERELGKIPMKDKTAYIRAAKECPDVVNDAHKLMFLRCEVFNADLAAKRFVRYWTRRLEFFGEKKAFKPLTLANIYDDDEGEEALRRGFLSINPIRHSTGRFIMLADPGKLDRTKYTREMLVRFVWYIFHALLEDEEVQKKGVIGIIYPRTTKFSEVEKKIMYMCTVSVKGCLPLRLSGFHVCHCPTMFRVIFPFVKMLMGPRLRKRLKLHYGSDKAVVKALKNFDINPEQISADMGGTWEYDHLKWIEERRNLE